MGQEYEVRAQSTIKRIKCNDYGDVILIDEADKGVFERLSRFIDDLNEMKQSAEQDNNALKERLASEEASSIEAVTEAAKYDIKYIQSLIEKVEKVFGSGCVGKVFRENYELNPDFIPDEDMIVDFLNQMIPLMEKIYGGRIKRVQQKYSVTYHGKGKRKK